MLSCFSCVWLFATPWSAACQAPLSMGFSRQKYWSGLSWIFLTQGSNLHLLCLLHWHVGSRWCILVSKVGNTSEIGSDLLCLFKRKHLFSYFFFLHLFFFFKKNNYFFIWLLQVFVVAWGIFSCGIWTLGWDLVPRPGIKPGPPASAAWSLSHSTTGVVPSSLLCKSLAPICSSDGDNLFFWWRQSQMGPRSTVGVRPEWMQGSGVDLLWEMGRPGNRPRVAESPYPELGHWIPSWKSELQTWWEPPKPVLFHLGQDLVVSIVEWQPLGSQFQQQQQEESSVHSGSESSFWSFAQTALCSWESMWNRGPLTASIPSISVTSIDFRKRFLASLSTD